MPRKVHDPPSFTMKPPPKYNTKLNHFYYRCEPVWPLSHRFDLEHFSLESRFLQCKIKPIKIFELLPCFTLCHVRRREAVFKVKPMHIYDFIQVSTQGLTFRQSFVNLSISNIHTWVTWARTCIISISTKVSMRGYGSNISLTCEANAITNRSHVYFWRNVHVWSMISRISPAHLWNQSFQTTCSKIFLLKLTISPCLMFSILLS